MTDMLGFNGFY